MRGKIVRFKNPAGEPYRIMVGLRNNVMPGGGVLGRYCTRRRQNKRNSSAVTAIKGGNLHHQSDEREAIISRMMTVGLFVVRMMKLPFVIRMTGATFVTR